MNQMAFVVFYLAGFFFTLLYLVVIGRSGLKRRLLQVAAALGWPVYWLYVQGPRSALVVLLRVASFVILGCALILLIPLVALERRHLVS